MPACKVAGRQAGGGGAMSDLLQAVGLRKHFGEVRAVHDLDVEIPWDGKTSFRVCSLWSNRPLPSDMAGGVLRIHVDRMEVYELILVEPSA